jgi:hypothetical protein
MRLGRDARAPEVADALVGIWRDIDSTLTPIVGRKGVAALHGRSLVLTAPEFPWLGRPSGHVFDTLDLDWLHRVTAARRVDDATTGAGSLLTAFDTLLISLIGPALSARLLRAVWEPPSSGDAAQDLMT